MARKRFSMMDKNRLLRSLQGIYVALGSMKASLIKIKLWGKADPEYLEAIDKELKVAEHLLNTHGIKVLSAKLIWKKEEPKVEEADKTKEP